MKKTEDRRIRKTKKQIRLGLAKMLETKNIDAITVKELVEAADINRSTFYLHYSNVHSLMDAVEEEIISDIGEILSYNSIFIRTGSYRNIQNLFNYIDDNQEIIHALLGPNSRPDFLQRINTMVYTECRTAAENNTDITLSDDFELALSFCLSGTIGIIGKWLDQPVPSAETDHVAETACKMILTSLDDFIIR